jgi:hypothetical protein
MKATRLIPRSEREVDGEGMRYVLFLRALYAHQLTVQPIYTLLKRISLFLQLPGLCWCLASGLTLNQYVKVDELVGESAHVVLEAKGVFPDCVGSEDIVPLALTLAVKEDLFIGICYFKVDIK